MNDILREPGDDCDDTDEVLVPIGMVLHVARLEAEVERLSGVREMIATIEGMLDERMRAALVEVVDGKRDGTLDRLAGDTAPSFRLLAWCAVERAHGGADRVWVDDDYRTVLRRRCARGCRLCPSSALRRVA